MESVKFFVIIFGGILFGFFLGILLFDQDEEVRDSNISRPSETRRKKFWGPVDKKANLEFHRHTGDEPEKHVLYDKVKVLCMVMTHPNVFKSRSNQVTSTWAKRCHRTLFLSPVQIKSENPPVINLNSEDGVDGNWNTTRAAFQYVYDHHFNEYEWFMRVEDDSFVVLENLRFLLNFYKSSDPIYFGCKFKNFVNEGYMNSGAGYVLSREALNRLINEAFVNSAICRSKSGGAADAELGKCLQNVKVYAGDSRDSKGRGRFFPDDPQQHIMGQDTKKRDWFGNNSYYSVKSGMECCSDSAITFHGLSAARVYTLEYFLYHLKPYGLNISTEITHPRDDETIEDNYKNMHRLNTDTFQIQPVKLE